MTHRRLAELDMTPFAGAFDLSHLEAIHPYLFSEICAWAGQTRTMNVGKRDPDDPRWMSTFAPANRISEGVHATHQFLSERHHLKGLNQKNFTTALAATYVTLNYLHPFPEGNGRSTLTMLAQLAREAEYTLDYMKISPQVWNRASSRSTPQRLIEDPAVARAADPTWIHEGFRHIVEPLKGADASSRSGALTLGLRHDEDSDSGTEAHESQQKGGKNMNRIKMMFVGSMLMVLAQAVVTPRAQGQVLTGDARLACEALLCLSAVGQAPGECSKALAKYEAMKAQLWFNPMAVYNFLKGCPKK